jgi:hypothetical protein
MFTMRDDSERLCPPEKGQYCEDEKYNEKDFRNARCTRSDTAEAENGSDNRDNKEDYCVIEHDRRPQGNY